MGEGGGEKGFISLLLFRRPASWACGGGLEGAGSGGGGD